MTEAVKTGVKSTWLRSATWVSRLRPRSRLDRRDDDGDEEEEDEGKEGGKEIRRKTRCRARSAPGIWRMRKSRTGAIRGRSLANSRREDYRIGVEVFQKGLVGAPIAFIDE